MIPPHILLRMRRPRRIGNTFYLTAHLNIDYQQTHLEKMHSSSNKISSMIMILFPPTTNMMLMICILEIPTNTLQQIWRREKATAVAIRPWRKKTTIKCVTCKTINNSQSKLICNSSHAVYSTTSRMGLDY